MTQEQYDCVDIDDIPARELAITHQQWRAAETRHRAEAAKRAVDIAGSLHNSARRSLKEALRVIDEMLKEYPE